MTQTSAWKSLSDFQPVMRWSRQRHENIIFKVQHRGGKHTKATMLQYMQSQPAKHICSRPLDFDNYNAVIHLGYVASQERFGLAIRAINKTRRFWPGEVQLIVAIDAGRMQTHLDMPTHCSFHTPETLQDVIDKYRRSGSLLIPDQNELAGDATLHALASGVPIDALNFRARPGDKVRSRHGHAFLAFNRASDHSN